MKIISPLINWSTLPEPNIALKFFSGPHVGLLIFYTDQILIILSIIQFKISQWWNNTLTPSLHKKTRLMCYNYTMNPSSSKFTISSFLTFLAYIFSQSISLKYNCIFSIYKVIDLSIRESPLHQNESFFKY